MSSVERSSRVRGAVLGQLIGDAAALGTHWIYDTEALLAKCDGEVKGFEAPSDDHYHNGKQPGDQTHYGDAALVLLTSIAENGDQFDSNAFGQAFYDHFSGEGYSGYRDKATKETIERVDEYVSKNPDTPIPFEKLGSKDIETASVATVAPLVAYADSLESLIEAATSFARVRQNTEKAIAYTKFVAATAYKLIDGSSPRDAIRQAVGQLEPTNLYASEVALQVEIVRNQMDKSVPEATKELGQGCSLEKSVSAAIHAFQKHPDDFETAILETVKAGGDNAGRAAMVGLLVGAHLGEDAIPDAWRQRLNADLNSISLFAKAS